MKNLVTSLFLGVLLICSCSDDQSGKRGTDFTPDEPAGAPEPPPANEPDPEPAPKPDNDDTSSPPPPAPKDPAPDPPAPKKPEKDDPSWSSRDKNSSGYAKGAATLVAVRTSSSEEYDRIVIEFKESFVPAWQVSYIDKPVYQCGSGAVSPILGDGWLQIKMEPANAHTEEGKPTVAPRERKFNYRNLLELELTCDFEAVTTWVAGVKSPKKYRVMELKNPSRLVIDIRN